MLAHNQRHPQASDDDADVVVTRSGGVLGENNRVANLHAAKRRGRMPAPGRPEARGEACGCPTLRAGC